MAPRTFGVEKPNEAVTVWNIHSPSHKLKIDARRGVWETFTDGDSRTIVGGDLNMTAQQVMQFNQTLQRAQRWSKWEPIETRHGDLYLLRNVSTDRTDAHSHRK